ncbi:preprotein translocase subunit SecG [Neolewinella lacunae]|uniref:Protein-export membrane protein SecG n=1 Tax=Neolewinella lacunae TaxID=1517758 RepID=A0A923TAA1_9BACT|nr:preprotein translocase subunit SecG [Neolewinella lacunae]MBC6996324.1 preprotein translocase subunit SecG [Neolewinella lacunae]MDN3636947.1 preprotein translocase subunit SecG [Neolewinella lacunae]
MVNFLTILTGAICVLLMIVVLVQNPKGGGIDSTFGGSQANQMLGASRSTDVIEKITWGLAAALFILCVLTALAVSAQGGGGGL